MTRGLILFGLLLVLPFASAVSLAEDCGDLLKPDLTNIQAHDHVRLSYLHTMSVEAFDKASRGGGAEANILVEGVPLKSIATYSEFSDRLRRESQQLSYTYEHDRSLWYYASRVPSERTEGFLDCINRSGLRFRRAAETSDKVLALEITWNAPVDTGNDNAIIDFSESSNVSRLPSRRASKFRDRASKILRFQRLDPNADMLIVGNTGLFSSRFISPAPLATPDPIELAARKCLGSLIHVQGSTMYGDCKLINIAISGPTRGLQVQAVMVAPNNSLASGSSATCYELKLGHSCDFVIAGSTWHAKAVEIGDVAVNFQLSRD